MNRRTWPSTRFRRWLKSGSVILYAATVLFAATACGSSQPSAESSASGDGWYEFQGSWTAAGKRRLIHLGSDRRASVGDFTGSMVLTGHLRPGVGFQVEAIALTDSATGMVGRSVWTDERGDQIYSELRGEGTMTSNRVAGTILGGTGRYTGATGSFEFSWRFVLESDDGTVQGQSTALKGRVHVKPQQIAPGAGRSQP